MKNRIKLASCAVTTLLASVSFQPTYGDAFSSGDIFAGSGSGGTIRHYNSSGTLLEILNTGSGAEQTGMAFDSAGNLYATSFGASRITRFSAVDGSVILPNPFVVNDVGSDNESISFSASGQFYVGQADGTGDILKRAADGTFLARYNVSTEDRGSDWIDLAADQKTMFYTSEGRDIRRYDVSTDTQLANFATLPGTGTAYAFRLLSDGGLLVADTGNIKRLDSSGAVVQTYDAVGEDFFFALNLDPDGVSFWSAGYGSGNIYKFNIASGAIGMTLNNGGGVSGLAIAGEITQGNPDTGVPDGGSTIALLATGFALLAGARGRKV